MTFHVIRKTHAGAHWLAPRAVLNAILRYALALARRRFDIDIHAACVLSNHFHLIVTAKRANLAEFMAWLNAVLARLFNAYWGRRGGLFQSGETETYRAIELLEAAQVFQKLVYVLTNPVKHGLVSRSHLWPGVWTGFTSYGKRGFRAERPGPGFGEGPQVAWLEVVQPPQFKDMAAVDFNDEVYEAVQAKEAELRGARAGKPFLGVEEVLKRDPRNWKPEPRIEEEYDDPSRRGPHKNVAASRPELAEARVREIRAFRVAYRQALAEYIAGDREVEFPRGTYRMRVIYRVRCEPFLTPE